MKRKAKPQGFLALSGDGFDRHFLVGADAGAAADMRQNLLSADAVSKRLALRFGPQPFGCRTLRRRCRRGCLAGEHGVALLQRVRRRQVGFNADEFPEAAIGACGAEEVLLLRRGWSVRRALHTLELLAR